jgi:7-cyano-7-deazaguanine synthase in queuosine biosynthesis
MRRRKSVECRIQGLRTQYEYDPVSFETGTDLSLVLNGKSGPRGISAVAADVLDFAAAVYQIERQVKRKNTSPPERFTLRMQLRRPDVWTDEAIRAAQDLLYLLGDATWELDLYRGLRAPIMTHQAANDKPLPTQVVLFSGGLDSTCGLTTIKAAAAKTQLVSFYTRQKSLQAEIASELGYARMSQWRMKWTGQSGPGHAFFYRSFLFLALASAIADSWAVRRILQFENGILACAIPPSTAWVMTKHAHPLLHEHASRLFGALYGGEWDITNPFLSLTKRGCVAQAVKAIGKPTAAQLLERTETCWFLSFNHAIGGKKRPGVPCGICVPCIVRRTALPGERYAYDLLKRRVRNNERQGVGFRSYYVFLDRVLKTKGAVGDFYALLPPSGRQLLSDGSVLSLSDLHKLFLDFAKDFMATFDVH